MDWNWGLFGLAGAVLLIGCLLPNRCLPARLPNDKLLHFIGFGGLGLLALRLAQNWQEGLLWLAGLLLASWAIECLQQLVPDRAFSWRDMAANAAGLGCAGMLAWLYTGF